MRFFDEAASELYKVLRAEYNKVELFDEDGNSTASPSEARRFYVKNTLLIALIDDGDNSTLRLYFDSSLEIEDVLDLIKTLKSFVTQYNLLITIKKSDKEIKLADYSNPETMESAIAENDKMNIFENMYGTSVSKYVNLENARLIIKENAVYVENNAGERQEFDDLETAKEIALYINDGGTFHDEVYNQIMRLATALKPLSEGRKYLVVDNEFNREHYNDMIGQKFDSAPGYAAVRVIDDEEITEDTDGALFSKSVNPQYLTDGLKSYLKMKEKNFFNHFIANDSGSVDFVVTQRNTKGMHGDQDKFSMAFYKDGNKVADLGSHPSLNGAKGWIDSKVSEPVQEAIESSLDAHGTKSKITAECADSTMAAALCKAVDEKEYGKIPSQYRVYLDHDHIDLDEGHKADLGVDNLPCPTCHGQTNDFDNIDSHTQCPACGGSGIESMKVLGRFVSKPAMDKLMRGQLECTPVELRNKPRFTNDVAKKTYYLGIVASHAKNDSLSNLFNFIGQHMHDEKLSPNAKKIMDLIAQKAITAAGINLNESVFKSNVVSEMDEWFGKFEPKRLVEFAEGQSANSLEDVKEILSHFDTFEAAFDYIKSARIFPPAVAEQFKNRYGTDENGKKYDDKTALKKLYDEARMDTRGVTEEDEKDFGTHHSADHWDNDETVDGVFQQVMDEFDFDEFAHFDDRLLFWDERNKLTPEEREIDFSELKGTLEVYLQKKAAELSDDAYADMDVSGEVNKLLKSVVIPKLLEAGYKIPMKEAVAKKKKVEEPKPNLKLVKTFSNGNKVAKVYKDMDWDEFRVKFYIDGVHQSKADAHSDKEDALATAQHFVGEAIAEDDSDELSRSDVLLPNNVGDDFINDVTTNDGDAEQEKHRLDILSGNSYSRSGIKGMNECVITYEGDNTFVLQEKTERSTSYFALAGESLYSAHKDALSQGHKPSGWVNASGQFIRFDEGHSKSLYYVQPDGKWKKGADGRSKGLKKEELPKGAKIKEARISNYVFAPRKEAHISKAQQFGRSSGDKTFAAAKAFDPEAKIRSDKNTIRFSDNSYYMIDNGGIIANKPEDHTNDHRGLMYEHVGNSTFGELSVGDKFVFRAVDQNDSKKVNVKTKNGYKDAEGSSLTSDADISVFKI